MRYREFETTVSERTPYTYRSAIYVSGRPTLTTPQTHYTPHIGSYAKIYDENGGNLAIGKRTVIMDAPHYQIGLAPDGRNGRFYWATETIPILPRGISSYVQNTLADPATRLALESNSMRTWGASQIARLWPTNPTADAANFIGELRQGLFKIPGSIAAQRKAGAVSGEFLNWNFGLMPVVSDLKKFSEAARTSDKRLRQLQRDSGKPVKRRRSGPEKTTFSRTIKSDLPDVQGFPITSVPLGVRTETVTTRSRTWFSGDFTYHLPTNEMSPAFNDMITKARYSWGAVPGIDTAWELTPFSWALDYFSNTGEVVKNLRRISEGNRVYNAYVMRSYSTERVISLSGEINVGGRMQKYVTSVTILDEYKFRIRANPFGFGVLDTEVTPMQVALLAAVGRQQTLRR